jgi:intracellular multiplication protein IcmJ
MYPLELKVQPGKWRTFAARKADPRFASFSEKVFRRDQYACQFCGFQARDYQEVINLDQNYHNNKISNMVTACCFCTQCFFLDAVGVSYGGGTLISMNEISQASLNSFCHVLFFAMTKDTGYRTTAQSLYRALKFRSQPIDQQFGEGTSEPSLFCQLLIDSLGFKLEKSEELLKNLRLLPSRAKFKEQIEHWAKTALSEQTTEG